MKLKLKFHLNKGRFNLIADTCIEWQQPCTHVIFGESGIGKTHLLRSISGLETPQGFIAWHNSQHDETWLDSKNKKTVPCHNRHVAMVFQDGQLFRHLNVRGNLEFAFKRSNSTNNDWDNCISALGLDSLLDHTIDQLSGGQAQRVALARAILSKPRLLILDEPLASLDWQSKQDVMGYIKQLNDQWKIPILYVTHDVNEVLTLADNIIMLEKIDNTTHVQTSRALIDVLQDDSHSFYGLGKSSILVTDKQGVCEDNLQTYHLGNQLIRIPMKPGEKTTNAMRLSIAASDVSLSLSAATDTSIVNILQGIVSRIEHTSNGQYLIQLNIEGQFLLSEISAFSFVHLSIEIGQPLFAQIKGIALQRNA